MGSRFLTTSILRRRNCAFFCNGRAELPKICVMPSFETRAHRPLLSQLSSPRLCPARNRDMHGKRTSLMLSLWAFLSQGCETQRVVIADWVCPQSSASTQPGSAGAGGVGNDSIPSEWSTSFEDLFCDYSTPRGFCYS